MSSRVSRRSVLAAGAAGLAAGNLVELVAKGQPAPPENDVRHPTVVTPNGSSLSWTMEDGCKTFRLVAEPVKREFAPGMVVECWGYNGQTPGPTIEAVEGDRVRIYVTNKLPEPTTVHWHGIILPNGMDGVG